MGDITTMCLYQSSGVVCTDKSKCARCGFNRRVNQMRLYRLRHEGYDAISKIVPKTIEEVDLYEDARRYIEANYIAFGGRMELDEIRKKLDIEPAKLWYVGRVAADIVNERRGYV